MSISTPARKAGRSFSLKSSHRRVTLKTSHRQAEESPSEMKRAGERESYIAPPKRRR